MAAECCVSEAFVDQDDVDAAADELVDLARPEFAEVSAGECGSDGVVRGGGQGAPVIEAEAH